MEIDGFAQARRLNKGDRVVGHAAAKSANFAVSAAFLAG
jgi:hypothetical protein